MFYDEEQYKHILEISDWRRYRKGLFPNQAVLLMSTEPIHNSITHTLFPQASGYFVGVKLTVSIHLKKIGNVVYWVSTIHIHIFAMDEQRGGGNF